MTDMTMTPRVVGIGPGPLVMVDDDDVDTMMVERSHGRSKLDRPFLSFADGESFLAYLDDVERNGVLPWLVLLDINMPGMTGFDVMKAMRANEAFRNVPVVLFYSNSDSQEDRARALTLGSDLQEKFSSALECVAFLDRLADDSASSEGTIATDARETRSVGSLTVSSVGLGCNNFGRKLDQADSAAVVNAAVDAGVTLFDTADVYGYGDHPYSGTGQSESFLGAALGARRSDVVIATKFGISMSKTDPTMRGGGAAWVHKACEGSLRRLGTDYIDLYQLHRPDRDSDISETLGALHELVIEGKVREIGCSNFSADQLRDANVESAALGTPKFSSVQNEYSLLRREVEDDVLPACSEIGMAFLPFFPLASGLLTGKYAKGVPAPEGTRLAFWEPREHQALNDDVLDRVDGLSAMAAQSGHSLLELAFSWLLARPQVASVIAGATSPEQVRSNVAAASWKLTDDELDAVDLL